MHAAFLYSMDAGTGDTSTTSQHRLDGKRDLGARCELPRACLWNYLPDVMLVATSAVPQQRCWCSNGVERLASTICRSPGKSALAKVWEQSQKVSLADGTLPISLSRRMVCCFSSQPSYFLVMTSHWFLALKPRRGIGGLRDVKYLVDGKLPAAVVFILFSLRLLFSMSAFATVASSLVMQVICTCIHSFHLKRVVRCMLDYCFCKNDFPKACVQQGLQHQTWGAAVAKMKRQEHMPRQHSTHPILSGGFNFHRL